MMLGFSWVRLGLVITFAHCGVGCAALSLFGQTHNHTHYHYHVNDEETVSEHVSPIPARFGTVESSAVPAPPPPPAPLAFPAP